MKFYSLNYNSQSVSFDKAVIQGLAPDRGLYFPEDIPLLPQSFFEEINTLSNYEIAYRAIQPFVGKAIGKQKLRTIVEDTLQSVSYTHLTLPTISRVKISVVAV